MQIIAVLCANGSGRERCRCFSLSFWNENHRESFPGSRPLMCRLWCLSRVHIINTPSVPPLIRIPLRHLHRGDAGVGPRLKLTSAKMFFQWLNIAAALVILEWVRQNNIAPQDLQQKKNSFSIRRFNGNWLNSLCKHKKHKYCHWNKKKKNTSLIVKEKQIPIKLNMLERSWKKYKTFSNLFPLTLRSSSKRMNTTYYMQLLTIIINHMTTIILQYYFTKLYITYTYLGTAGIMHMHYINTISRHHK